MQYFDPLVLPAAPPPHSPPDSSSPGFPHSSICIDPQSDKKDDNMEIKAALPEAFTEETRDASRWLMAMEVYFILHEDKYPDLARTMVFLNRMSKGSGKPFVTVDLTGYRRLEYPRGLIIEERIFYEMRYL